MRLSTFIDAGQVYESGQKLSLSTVRYAYGIGFAWISPVGPLRLSYAFPYKKGPEDKVQRGQFQLGQVF
jgi:outer membrane protein insertion porin family